MEKQDTKWVCLVCAALYPEVTEVPPPDGFVLLGVHEDVAKTWNLPSNTSGPSFTRACSPAMSLLLAWSIECVSINVDEFQRGNLTYERNKPEGKATPILFKRPRWYDRQTFQIAAYADSDEDQLFHDVLCEALRDPEWTRTAILGDVNSDLWAHLKPWSQLLPESHPFLAKGFEVARLIPWRTISQGVAIEGRVFDPLAIDAVETGILALIQSRFLPANVPLWQSIGLKRFHDGTTLSQAPVF